MTILDFLEPGQTINSQHYITRPTSRRLELPESGQRRQHFSRDTVTPGPHASLKTVEHTSSICWTILTHLPYTPDLAPSDFHLFRSMKDGLYGQCFPRSDAVTAAVKQWVTSTGADFECGMQAFAHYW